MLFILSLKRKKKKEELIAQTPNFPGCTYIYTQNNSLTCDTAAQGMPICIERVLERPFAAAWSWFTWYRAASASQKNRWSECRSERAKGTPWCSSQRPIRGFECLAWNKNISERERERDVLGMLLLFSILDSTQRCLNFYFPRKIELSFASCIFQKLHSVYALMSFLTMSTSDDRQRYI